MELKDWVTLLIPIFCNGIVVFFLQKLFEKKQAKNLILHEYYSELRRRIDVGLELHAKATRLANEANPNNDAIINSTIGIFFNSCLDVYYYYVQNMVVFSSVKKECEKLSGLLMELSKGVNAKPPIQISKEINAIRDTLQDIKRISIR